MNRGRPFLPFDFGQSRALAERRKPGLSPHQIAEQDLPLSKDAQAAEHLREMHRFMEEVKDAVVANDPMIKYEPQTLDPNQEVIIRYEGRYRYAIRTTEANQVVTYGWGAKTWNETYAAPGWQPLDLPAGTRMLSGDANRHFIIVRMSNLKA